MTSAAWVLDRCADLATLSARPDAIDRAYLTPEHAAANAAAATWMRAAGLDPWTDAAGNVWGRRGMPAQPALVLGSHLDTVPDAGPFDGMLGVCLAIAVAARLRDVLLPFALEVVGFSDEEGARFGKALLGSCAVSGEWDDAWWEQRDADGVTLRQAFERFGLDPARVGEAARHPRDLVGYLEAHIEQGPLLEAAGRALGTVTSIAGARRFLLTVTGEARHAGGTPYERRKDALVAASLLVVEVERLARATGGLATVGRLTVEPGATNVVPGRVELTLDLRARTDDARDDLWRAVEAAAQGVARERGVRVDAFETHRARSTVCASGLTDAVRQAVAAVTGLDDVPALWSPAGHDAMALAAVTDVAVLFVRCHDGISHHPAEDVREDDVALALDALEGAVRAVARQVQRTGESTR